MTTEDRLDPKGAGFWDEESLLAEERRMFDVCHGCRLCFNLCPAFPTLFDLTDGVDGDLTKLSRQDLRPVEDSCYQCKLCYIRCPYIPPHRLDLDVPRLFMRAKFVNTKKDGLKLQDRILADTDLAGKVGGLAAPLANRGQNIAPVRFVMEKSMGIHRDAKLPKFHARTFAAWFKRNGKALNHNVSANAQKVALFHTCYVNYNDPEVGIATAQVLARNNLRVMVPEQQCCGMPFADAGAMDNALKKVHNNVSTLSQVVRDGYDIVTPGPSCGLMMKQEYPSLAQTEESKLVAEHTFDTSEYLWKLRGSGSLNTDFNSSRLQGKVKSIGYHVPCHIRAQFMGNKSADLMGLIPDMSVEQVERCSHHDGTWGVKKDSHAVSLEYAEKLFQGLKDAEADLYVTDCPLASMQIDHGTGSRPLHPMQVMKEAYGI